MALRKRLRSTAGAGTETEGEAGYDTETLAVDDADRHGAEYTSTPDEFLRRAEKMERELREAMSRTSLAMTDARVALDKAEKSTESIEELMGRLEKVVECTETIQAEHEEYGEALGSLETLIEDANSKIGDINTRIADIEGLVSDIRSSVGSSKGGAAAGDPASSRALEQKLAEFERRYDEARKQFPDARSLEQRFAEFQRRYEEKLQHTSHDLRAQVDELRKLQHQLPHGKARDEGDHEAEPPPESSELEVDLNDILQVMLKHDAPDLHLKVGVPPTVRMGGELIPVGNQILTEKDCRRLVLGAMTRSQRRRLMDGHEVNFTYVLEDSRFTINAYLQRGTVSATFRMLRTAVPHLDELSLPAPLTRLGGLQKGLVLVTGLSGSGRSTTLASLVDYINTTRKCHIVTIEEPIKFIHHDNESMVTQREVGTDTQSFQEALRQILRQDPDVIMISELSEPEAMMEAVCAADTGRLVIAGMHTPNAIATLKRLITSFSGDRQRRFCLLLSSTLRGILSQKLLARADEGRIPAVEYLSVTPAVAGLIAECRLGEIYPHLADEDNPEMRTFTASILELVEAGYVTREEAERQVERTSEVRSQARRQAPRASAPAVAEKPRQAPGYAAEAPASRGSQYAGPQDYMIASMEEEPVAEEESAAGDYVDFDNFRVASEAQGVATHPALGGSYYSEDGTLVGPSPAAYENTTYEAPQAKDIIASAIRGARPAPPAQQPMQLPAAEAPARRLSPPGDAGALRSAAPAQPAVQRPPAVPPPAAPPAARPAAAPPPAVRIPPPAQPARAPAPGEPQPSAAAPVTPRQAPPYAPPKQPSPQAKESADNTILDWL